MADVSFLNLIEPRNASHLFANTLAYFIGKGFCLSIIENIKTAHQLGKINPEQGVGTEPSRVSLLPKGTLTSFGRETMLSLTQQTTKKLIKEIPSLSKIFFPAIRGYPGLILGTILVYPLDVMRTKEASIVFAGPLEVVDRNASIFSTTSQLGVSVYNGLEAELASAVLKQMIIDFSLSSVESLYYWLVKGFTRLLHIPFTGKSAVHIPAIYIIVFTLAKVLTNPLEVAKKKIQNRKTSERHYGVIATLQQIYQKEGVNGLFVGWHYSILEAFVSIAVTRMVHHYTHKLLE